MSVRTISVGVLNLALICICDGDSNIYCYGSLLDTVQRTRFEEDSKTFVDMKLKHPPEETLAKFNEFLAKHRNKPQKPAIRNFVKATFDPEGQEFED